MKKEQNKALTLLFLAAIPLLLEMHADMSTIVDWRVLPFLLLYFIFSMKATKAYKRETDQFVIYSQCCKASLMLGVFYTWLSLFSNIGKSIVPCLLFQAEGKPDYSLIDCRRHGLITKCLKSVSLMYRANAMANQCPISVLGTSLGSIYTIAVLLCRFVPVAFYGLWNLYVWDNSVAFEDQSIDPSSLPKEDRYYIVPSSKILLVSALAVLSCLIVNISLQELPPLVHVSTTLPFFCIIMLHYNMETKRYRDNVKHVISSMMSTCLYVSICYSIIDFVMNCLSLVNLCTKNDIHEESILDKCSDPEGPMSIQQCYESVSKIDVTFFASGKCPTFGSPSATLRYIGDTIMLMVLTVGLLVAFFCTNKQKGRL